MRCGGGRASAPRMRSEWLLTYLEAVEDEVGAEGDGRGPLGREEGVDDEQEVGRKYRLVPDVGDLTDVGGFTFVVKGPIRAGSNATALRRGFTLDEGTIRCPQSLVNSLPFWYDWNGVDPRRRVKPAYTRYDITSTPGLGQRCICF